MGLSFSVLWVITKLTFLRGGEAGLNQFELAFLLLATKCALTETNNINSKIASKSVEFPISKMVHEKHQGKSIRTGNALLLATPKPHLAFLIEICVCYLKQRMRANKRRLPFPSPGNLPNPGIELRSPALQADSLPSEPPEEPLWSRYGYYYLTVIEEETVA